MLPFWSLADASSCPVAPSAPKVNSVGKTEMVVIVDRATVSRLPVLLPPQALRTTTAKKDSPARTNPPLFQS